jgi:hypothetical protein
MHVTSGLRRLAFDWLRSCGWSGPWGRQSRTCGPGRSASFAKIAARRGPPLISAPRACPPAPQAMRFTVGELATRGNSPVGARLRAISPRSGEAAGRLASVAVVRSAAVWWRRHPLVSRRREGFRVYGMLSAPGVCAGYGIAASSADRAQARSYKGRGFGVPACAARNGVRRRGGGQALAADMSGGPRDATIFATGELRPGPQVRDWRPSGPDRSRSRDATRLRRRTPLSTRIRASE